jgi:hypothetical protein
MHPAERRLAQVAREVAWLQSQLPKAFKNLGLLAQSPAGAAEVHTSGGDVADPTANSVAARMVVVAKAEQIDSLAAELDGVTAELVRAVRAVPNVALDTSREAEALRCSGGEGEWENPLCTRLAVRTVPSEVRRPERIEVCWSCYSRYRRQSQREASCHDMHAL